MVVGAIGLVYGFIAAPETIEDVEAMMASEHHGEEHATDETHEVNVEQIPGGNTEVENIEHTEDNTEHVAGADHAEAGRLWPFKKAENPDVRTTDDLFLMEVDAANHNIDDLTKFLYDTGASEIRLIDNK